MYLLATSLRIYAQAFFFLTICLAASASVSLPAPDASGKYTLSSPSHLINASFIPYSAAITNLWIHDKSGVPRDVVLGYDNASTYASDPLHPNYGAVPGRYANRLTNATYTLPDSASTRYFTQRNYGNSTMHSGTNGWSYRFWDIEDVRPDSIVFSIRDESNSSTGFPGLVLGRATYTLTDTEWRIRLEARAETHETPLMLTSHAYWNLDAFARPKDEGGDGGTVLEHVLSFPDAKRLIKFEPDGQTGVPEGRVEEIPVGAINDFWSAPKMIGANESAEGWVGNCGPGTPGYDCGWTVDRDPSGQQGKGKEEEREQWKRTPIASLSSEWSGIRWDMYSNQEGVVMTNCGFLPPDILPLKSTQIGPANDGFVPRYGAVAVEAQDWVSGISFPQWGRLDKQVWGPGKGVYVNEIVYRFRVEE